MVLAEGIVLILFKGNKSPVVQPFPITSFTNLMLAENVPSACTLEVTPETEKEINRSHLVMESPSMGLLMRYVLERDYNIELDFTDAVPIRINGKDEDFCFNDLLVQREIAQLEENSGVVRSTFDGPIYIYVEGGFLSSSTWARSYCVLTNLGLFMFNEKDVLEPPELIGIKTLKFTTMKGQKRNGKTNLFELEYEFGEKKEKIRKMFSVEDPQSYTKWERKISDMVKERREKKKGLILPVDE